MIRECIKCGEDISSAPQSHTICLSCSRVGYCTDDSECSGQDHDPSCGSEFDACGCQKDDPISHPSHYTSGKIEVADFIYDQRLDFHRGNIVKYASRSGKKDPGNTAKEIEDLRKAAWYANDLANRLEQGE